VLCIYRRRRDDIHLILIQLDLMRSLIYPSIITRRDDFQRDYLSRWGGGGRKSWRVENEERRLVIIRIVDLQVIKEVARSMSGRDTYTESRGVRYNPFSFPPDCYSLKVYTTLFFPMVIIIYENLFLSEAI
jgi:hypothetical protein